MFAQAFIAGVELHDRGWRLKLKVFPGEDAHGFHRLHDDTEPDFMYVRLPCSENEARKWGAVVGGAVTMTLTLDPTRRATLTDKQEATNGDS